MYSQNAVKMRVHYEINMYFGNELKHSGPRIHFDIKNQTKKCLAPFSEDHWILAQQTSWAAGSLFNCKMMLAGTSSST